MFYTDISIIDLEETAFPTIAQNSSDGLRTSNDGERVLIKWQSDIPKWLKKLNPVVRTQEQARVHYKKVNGWD